MPNYQKSKTEVGGFLQCTLNCLDTPLEWVQKRKAVQTVIEKSLQKLL